MTSPTQPSAWLTPLLRISLLLHPAHARRRYGSELQATTLARYHHLWATGPLRAVGYGIRAVVDVARTGLGERLTGSDSAGRTGGGTFGELGTDVRVAFRTLRKTPGFTLAAATVLALGIGGNTALFSALRATLLAPPPFPDPGRLVMLDITDSSSTRADPPRGTPWSYPKFELLEGRSDLPLESLAAYAPRSLTLTGEGEATLLNAEVVSSRYFHTLGIVPVAGRDFASADDAPDAAPVVMLEYGLWQDRFGGDRRIVGSVVTLNGRSVTVAGVAPAGFRGLTGGARFWIPVPTGAALISPSLMRGAQAHWLRVVARMEPGVDVELVADRMHVVGRMVEATYPTPDPTAVRSASAQTLMSARIHPQARTSLLVLGVASTLLLLVACANLAGLLGARALDRSREAAVRVAIGAGRLRVARSFLAEAVVLALLGGALSILVAGLGIKGLAALWPDRFLMGSWNVHAAGIGSVGVDGTVLSFAGAAAVMVGLLFGLVPALTASRTDPASALRGSSIPSSGLRQHLSLRSVLVTAEIALALVLLVGAGLLIRSLRELQRVDRGYQPGNLVVFDYAIPRTSALAKNEALFADEYLTRLNALPDVVAAGLGCVPPSGGHCMITGVWRAADQAWEDGFRPWIGVHSVSDGYFETLGIPVLQGRTFTSEDQNGSKAVVVLSNSAIHRLFPDGHAVGNTVAIGGDDPAEVIGVVGDVLYDRPEQATIPESYLSHRQDSGGSMVVLRTRGEPFAVIPAARAALADLAPEIPLYNVRTLADLDAASYADTRVLSLLLSAFAGLALLLACTGVWAVVAFSVARRTRELGLRMALGASARSVVALTVRTGVSLGVAGLLLGLGGAWAATRLMRGVLYGVQPSDPTAFATSGAVLFGVACLAAWLPARRATRVQPMEALRVE